MTIVESFWGQDAFLWQADWFASKVKAALGTRFNDNFRLWFTDHALHGDVEQQADSTHTVSYLGALHQAIRDLSVWVEKGVPPPPGTTYKVMDGQVEAARGRREAHELPTGSQRDCEGWTARRCGGGQPVTFSAVIEVPPQTGRVVAAEWGFVGEGTFAAVGDVTGKSGTRVVLKATHTFSKHGTYFPGASRRLPALGRCQESFRARIQNLFRVRVIVR